MRFETGSDAVVAPTAIVGYPYNTDFGAAGLGDDGSIRKMIRMNEHSVRGGCVEGVW